MSDISKVRTLLGPPGTGKTSKLLDQIESLLEAGVLPQQIAFVSYTKAAVTNGKDRASSRFDLDPDAFEYFRTIHSMAFLAIGKRDVMGDKEWMAFGESFAYSFSDQGDEPTLNYAEDGDCLRSLHELRRVKRCSVEEAILHAGDVPDHIYPAMVELFASRLADWKRDKNVIDFTDMLEMCLKTSWKPLVRFAFIDESQDNSRLQNALTKQWFWENSRCESVTYAGDDDQAIYGWSGGDRGALVRLASKTQCDVLKQSHRVPQIAHRLAQSIIRMNKARVQKEYSPREASGSLLSVHGAREAIEECPDEAMVLVRNAMFAEDHRAALIEAGRSFSCEIGKGSPLDRKDPLGAFRAVAAWRRGGNATASDFISLLACIPSRIDDQPVIPRGVKTKAKANEDPVPMWRARDQFGLEGLLSVLLRESDFLNLLRKLAPEERRYLEVVLARDPGLTRGKIVITTVHRSKGRESPCVVIAPNMANRTFRAYASGRDDKREEENSVQYVAATRTKDRLIVERPTDYRRYEYEQHVRSARKA